MERIYRNEKKPVLVLKNDAYISKRELELLKILIGFQKMPK